MNKNITEKTTLLSRKGMRELKKNIAQLEHDRNKMIRTLHEHDKANDHEENLDRIDHVFRLEGIEAELADKKLILSSARLIPNRRDSLKVTIGSIVDLIDMQGRLFRYKIVDSIEADPSDGRISYLSPLGKNLLDKTIHDIIEWGNGLRYNQFKLINIA